MWRRRILLLLLLLLPVSIVDCVVAAAATAYRGAQKFNLSRDEYRTTVEWCIENDSVDVAAWLFGDDASAEERRSSKTLWTVEDVHKRSLDILVRCGYVKLKHVLDPELVQRLHHGILKYLKQNPKSPLLNSLRGSGHGNDRLDDNKLGLPWWGASTRAELGIPFEFHENEEFREGIFREARVIMPLVNAFLNTPFNFSRTRERKIHHAELDIAAFLSVGPQVAEQMPHTDVPHLGILRSIEGKAYKVSVDAPRLASIQRGELTFALNVQIPMVDVTEENGPTQLCAASHNEAACFLAYNCQAALSKEGGLRPDPEFCSPGGLARRHGTNNVGDVLVYDSRLLHWGGANVLRGRSDFRDVVSLSFVHPWWDDKLRPLTAEGRIEASKWRKWRANKDDEANASFSSHSVSDGAKNTGDASMRASAYSQVVKRRERAHLEL